MDLKEFVKTAISEIVEGIVDAEEIVKKHNAHVNPATQQKGGTRENNHPVATIQFDVALAQSQSGELTGKTGKSYVIRKISISVNRNP